MKGNVEQGPLTEAVYYILLALYKPMHGYGVMQKIKKMTNNRVSLGPGTLYGALNTLLEKGWIEQVITEEHSRKKEYYITDSGKVAVENEIKRLEELLKNGKTITGGA